MPFAEGTFRIDGFHPALGGGSFDSLVFVVAFRFENQESRFFHFKQTTKSGT